MSLATLDNYLSIFLSFYCSPLANSGRTLPEALLHPDMETRLKTSSS
ncbi:hypothetical protein HMPREF0322_03284 [Desulfitobacterium hafniense DP7]|uniref:Uncharacterized protein n=1 Tax=Desulfitobacterium hafniense DP7 TaxID=537010 RepID=G9XQN6_DESHA|nr:hypothetical protein HMPREF0322_03284 [Desulfitobacterium hafniense DP7]